MQIEIMPYSVIFLISCVIDLAALWLVLSKPRFPGKTWLILEITAVFVWNFCLMFAYSTIDFSNRMIWSKLAYLGANTVSPILLIFFLHYPIAKFKISDRNKFLLFVIPVITITLVMTNELHHRYWPGITLLSAETNSYVFSHGIFYWFALSYNYLCGLICLFLMATIIREYKGLYRTQALILLIASIFPFLSGLFYSFAPGLIPGLDYLPLGYTIAAVGLVVSVIFFRMLDVVPIGRNVMIDTMQIGLIVIDDRNRVVDINPAAQTLLRSQNLKVGDLILKAGESVANHLVNNIPQAEIEIDTGADTIRYYDLSTTRLKDHTGVEIGKMGILRDITENHTLRRKLQEMANHDPLTGIPNRRLFFDRIDCVLAEARRNKKKFALLSLDLDHFKEVNDKFGHAVGDQVLFEMAQRLISSLREMDIVARFGGDEFMILVRDIHTHNDVKVVLRKILDIIQLPLEIQEVQWQLSASIGVAIYPDDGLEAKDLLNKSDQALYKAKAAGRNKALFHSEI